MIPDPTLPRSLSTTGSETLTRQVLFHLPLEDRIQTKCVEDTDVELGKLRRTNKKSHFKTINQEEELKIQRIQC